MLIEQIDQSMSELGALARRSNMNKPLSECSYEEQVAKYLEGWGFLNAAEVVSTHADYVTKAKSWGMTSLRCAKNLETKWRGR